jgi:hypothetical protein
MLKVVALAAALSACAHPRRALVGGAGMIALGVLAEATNHTTYCSDPEGYRCLGTQIGDGVTNDIAHGAGEMLLVGGIVAVIGGLVGLSNEHAAEAHKM